jgi:hypothetical protein
MPKKLTVEVEDEPYQRLCGIAGDFKLDVKQAVGTILTSVGGCDGSITRISELSGPDKSLSSALYAALGNYWTIACLFNDVLSKVKAEGKFTVDIANVEINWEDDFFSFHFDSATDDYNITNLLVRKEDGTFCLSTYTSVQLKETKNNCFDDLKAAAESAGNPFSVGECRIYGEDSFDDSCYLVIDCFDGSLECLPTVKQVDRVIKRILRKAKIQLEK